MINLNTNYKVKNVMTIDAIFNEGSSIELIVLGNNEAIFEGFSGNIVVKNKYGKILKNKRLQRKKKYQVKTRFSITGQKFIITEMREID